MEKINLNTEDDKAGGKHPLNKSEWKYDKVSSRPELVLKSPEGQEKARLTSGDINTIERLGFLIDNEGVFFRIKKTQKPSGDMGAWKQRLIEEFGLKFEGMI